MCERTVSLSERIQFYRDQPLCSADMISFVTTIIRKAEITGNLYAEYDEAWKPLMDSAYLSNNSIDDFLRLSLRVYAETQNYCLLNGVLKVSGGCLSNPPYRAPDDINSLGQNLVETIRVP